MRMNDAQGTGMEKTVILKDRPCSSKPDPRTRRLMISEIMTAVRNGNICFSNRFTTAGMIGWVQWLTEAVLYHDAHWLEEQLIRSKAFDDRDGPDDSDGIPLLSERQFASVQFHRFYMAAVCRRALEDGVEHVYICRSDHNPDEPADSRFREYDAADLLVYLRLNSLASKLPLLKPEAGLSVDYRMDEPVPNPAGTGLSPGKKRQPDIAFT